jgi:hypothetical protein
MTRHKALHTGLVSPSPLDRWINALLHAFAMLVSFAASICSMRLSRCPAECHSDATLEALPCTKSGKLKETPLAAASSRASTSSNAEEALMVSSTRSVRPSNLSRSEGRVARGESTVLSTSHPRPCAEDLGSRRGGTLTIPHDLPTEILGTSPRMTRCLFRWETAQASAPN